VHDVSPLRGWLVPEVMSDAGGSESLPIHVSGVCRIRLSGSRARSNHHSQLGTQCWSKSKVHGRSW